MEQLKFLNFFLSIKFFSILGFSLFLITFLLSLKNKFNLKNLLIKFAVIAITLIVIFFIVNSLFQTEDKVSQRYDETIAKIEEFKETVKKVSKQKE